MIRMKRTPETHALINESKDIKILFAVKSGVESGVVFLTPF